MEREAFQGDALGREPLIGGVPYTAVGVMAQSQTTMEEGGGDDLAYIPYENAMQLSGSGFVSLYQMTARSRDTVEQARALLVDLMVQKFPDPDAEYNQYMITTMLEQVQQKPDNVLLITKCLYKQTAQHFETTSSCVERNLRTLVRACWRQPDHTLLDQIAGRPLRKPPTNMQFLDMLSAYLRK